MSFETTKQILEWLEVRNFNLHVRKVCSSHGNSLLLPPPPPPNLWAWMNALSIKLNKFSRWTYLYEFAFVLLFWTCCFNMMFMTGQDEQVIDLFSDQSISDDENIDVRSFLSIATKDKFEHGFFFSFFFFFSPSDILVLSLCSGVILKSFTAVQLGTV